MLARMLEILRGGTKERIVIVSNFTQTLDLVAQVGIWMALGHPWKACRLCCTWAGLG